MGRIYDYAKKLEADGIYTSREAQVFAPPGVAKDGFCLFQEAGMSTEQVDEQIKLMMMDVKFRKAKKADEFDIDSI